jgi:hypothetical protein
MVVNEGSREASVQLEAEQRAETVTISTGRACNKKRHRNSPPKISEIADALKSRAKMTFPCEPSSRLLLLGHRLTFSLHGFDEVGCRCSFE